MHQGHCQWDVGRERESHNVVIMLTFAPTCSLLIYITCTCTCLIVKFVGGKFRDLRVNHKKMKTGFVHRF